MSTAIQVVPQTGEVLPTFDMPSYLAQLSSPKAMQQQKALMAAYDAACAALIGPNDVQVVKQGGKTQEFKKKSAWKKLARHFGISTVLVRERIEVDEQGDIVATVIKRAIAPWGQSAESLAKCSTHEKRFAYDKSKAHHDCAATADTRADNRAISNLIAMGEVSAEEVEGDRDEHNGRQQGNGPKARKVSKAQPELRTDEHQEPEPVKRSLEWAKAFPLPWKKNKQFGEPIGGFSRKHLSQISAWIEERMDTGEDVSQESQDLYDAAAMIMAEMDRLGVDRLNGESKSVAMPSSGAVQDALTPNEPQAA